VQFSPVQIGMRLSLAIVFLLGTIVVTEVMCDTVTPAEVLQLRTWFEPTLARLESGQTLKQNRPFVEFAMKCAEYLVRTVSFGRLLKILTLGLHHDDNALIERIEWIQYDGYGLLHFHDHSSVHVKHILKAIKEVLRGDHKSARDAIEESRLTLPDEPESPPSGEHGGPSNPDSTSEYLLGIFIDVREIPDYVINGTLEQISTIRAWLRSSLSNLIDHAEFRTQDFALADSVAEIAQALVNSLGSQYLASEKSKFIGRFSFETASEIGGRILKIEREITSATADRTPALKVVVLKSVLKAIGYMMRENFQGAMYVINGSIWDYRYTVQPADESFFTFMDKTYFSTKQ
jgi:hypothetical protein